MEIPRLGVESKLQLQAYATTIPDPSCICDLCHSLRQYRILSTQSETRDQTRSLMVPSWICFHCAMTGTPATIYCITLDTALPELPQLQGLAHCLLRNPGHSL